MTHAHPPDDHPRADVAQAEPARADVVIITGMSGAGRTTAGEVLEDRGWHVVHNIPPRMMVDLLTVLAQEQGAERVAVVLDIRTPDFTAQLGRAQTALREQGWAPRVVFIDASDQDLVRRFDAVRRPHPLQGEGRLLEGIQEERALLSELRSRADVIVDTSSYNVHQLSAKIDSLLNVDTEVALRLTVMSFGFKHGIPLDADTVLDLRFLPNPHWNPELRPFTGKDPAVRDFVLGQELAGTYLNHVEALLRTSVEGYLAEGRRFVTVAIGCTGGKHRSVAGAEEVARRLRGLSDQKVQLATFHRDLGRE